MCTVNIYTQTFNTAKAALLFRENEIRENISKGLSTKHTSYNLWYACTVFT